MLVAPRQTEKSDVSRSLNVQRKVHFYDLRRETRLTSQRSSCFKFKSIYRKFNLLYAKGENFCVRKQNNNLIFYHAWRLANCREKLLAFLSRHSILCWHSTRLQVAVPDVVEAAKDADILIFVIPHQFIKGLGAQMVGKIKPSAIGLSLIKGFDVAEGGGIELISHIITRHLKVIIKLLRNSWGCLTFRTLDSMRRLDGRQLGQWGRRREVLWNYHRCQG